DGTVSAPADVTVPDIVLPPRFLLSGQVLDVDGVAVSGAQVSGSAPDSDAGAFHFQWFFSGALTDASGRVGVTTFPGMATLNVTPRAGSGLAPFPINNVNISGPLTLAVSVQFLSESTSAPAVAPGGTISTDAEGDGATPADPIETQVTTP